MSDELKPCPLCKSNNLYLRESSGRRNLQCINCGIFLSDCDEDRLIKKWNKRQHHPAIKEVYKCGDCANYDGKIYSEVCGECSRFYADNFEERIAIKMNFIEATAKAKEGKKICREGWNGKGLFVIFQKKSEVDIAAIRNDVLSDYYFKSNSDKMIINPHFMIKNVDNTISTWVPSINDCLAEDWVVL